MGTLGAVACVCAARGPGEQYKTVTFDTTDGVTLDGNLLVQRRGGRQGKTPRSILHNFDDKTGGSSRDDGWDDLAKQLSSEGYSVFSFDFRGFGDSTNVSKEVLGPDKGRTTAKPCPSGE